MTVLAGRRGLLCLVTDGERIAPRGGGDARDVEGRLVAQVQEAADAGIDLVQVRELALDTRALCRLVERCLAAAAGRPTRILVNDRADVALATGAHGVHLRGDSCPPERVRAIAPAGFLVGRSVHDPDEAAVIASEGAADYLVFGTVFVSRSKTPGHPTAGIEGLVAAVRAARPVPVLAIGGMSLEGASLVAATGASGLAAIGLFLPGGRGSAAPLADTIRRLRAAFDTVSDRD